MHINRYKIILGNTKDSANKSMIQEPVTYISCVMYALKSKAK